MLTGINDAGDIFCEIAGRGGLDETAAKGLRFIGGLRGVFARRLENYLARFKWMWCFKVRRSADELAELIVSQADCGTYETTWRRYKVSPHPFCDYWVKRARRDARARHAEPFS